MVLSKKRGFTLIELMVVIAIIAVLAAVVAPQVFRQVAKSRAASAVKFYNAVKSAATAYYSDTGAWPPINCGPPSYSSDCNNVSPGFVNGTVGVGDWDGPYLERWPETPPWMGMSKYWYWVYPNSTGWSSSVPADERVFWISDMPAADMPKIDTAIDGAINATSGLVRYGAFAGLCGILISRDGPVD